MIKVTIYQDSEQRISGFTMQDLSLIHIYSFHEGIGKITARKCDYSAKSL